MAIKGALPSAKPISTNLKGVLPPKGGYVNLVNPQDIKEPSFMAKVGESTLNFIDKLNTASYAVGGMISGEGVSKGIENKTSPSKALGIQNPYIAFTVDVLTDPTTYLSFGAGAGVKSGVSIGGKILSKTGIQELAKVEGKLLEEVISKGGKLDDALKTSIKEKAKVELAKNIEKIPGAFEKVGVAIAGKRLATLPGVISKPLTKLGEVVEASKAGQVVGKMFGGTEYAIKTAKGISLAEKEATLQLLRTTKNKLSLARESGITLGKDLISRYGEKTFNLVRDIVERIPRGKTAVETMQSVSKGVKDLVVGGIIKESEGAMVKKAVVDSIKVLKPLEKQLVKRGIVGATKEFEYFPRLKEVEGGIKGFAKRLFGSTATKGRVIKKIITEGGEGIVKKGKGFVTGIEGELKGKTFTEITSKVVDTKIKKLTDKFNIKTSNLNKAITKAVGPVKQELIKKKNEAIVLYNKAKKDLQSSIGKYQSKGKQAELRDVTAREVEEKTKIRYEKEQVVPFVKSIIDSKNKVILDDFYKHIANNIGKVEGFGVKKIGAEGVEDGFIDLGKKTDIESFKGLQMPEDVFNIAKGTLKYYSDDDQVKLLAKGFDKLTNYFKTFALIGVSYHTRNMLGNFWNNFLAGVKNPIRYLEAVNLQRKTVLSKTEKQLLDNAREQGVLRGGFYGGDILETIRDEISKPSWNPLSRRNYLAKGSQEVGTFLENNARLAHFIDRVKKGDSYVEAGNSVKKFLFDYTDLSDVEKSIFKRIFPFYSWTRKNIPLQLEQMVKQPGKAAALGKIQNIIEPENAEEVKSSLSEWRRNGHPIVLPFNDSKGKPYVINLDGVLPVYDLTMFFAKNPMKEIMDMLSPYIKLPIEFTTNKDLFTLDAISKVKGNGEGVWGDLLDFSTPIKTQFLGGLFNETQTKAINTFLRPLRDLDTLLQPGRSEKEIKDGVERLTQLILARTSPIDIFEGKQMRDYQDQKYIDDLKSVYKGFYRKYLKYDNPLYAKNSTSIENKLIELGLSPDEMQDVRKSILVSEIKYEGEADKLVRQLVKEGGRKPTATELMPLAKELSKYYKSKSYKTAYNEMKRVIEEQVNKQLK